MIAFEAVLGRNEIAKLCPIEEWSWPSNTSRGVLTRAVASPAPADRHIGRPVAAVI